MRPSDLHSQSQFQNNVLIALLKSILWKILLTANDRIVTKNAQAAQNHCTLHIAKVASSTPANRTMTDAGINTLDTNKSANATLAMNALPGKR